MTCNNRTYCNVSFSKLLRYSQFTWFSRFCSFINLVQWPFVTHPHFWVVSGRLRWWLPPQESYGLMGVDTLLPLLLSWIIFPSDTKLYTLLTYPFTGIVSRIIQSTRIKSIHDRVTYSGHFWVWNRKVTPSQSWEPVCHPRSIQRRGKKEILLPKFFKFDTGHHSSCKICPSVLCVCIYTHTQVYACTFSWTYTFVYVHFLLKVFRVPYVGLKRQNDKISELRSMVSNLTKRTWHQLGTKIFESKFTLHWFYYVLVSFLKVGK